MSQDFDIENDIRVAGPDDFQELFRIACLLHSEHGIYPFSEDKVHHLIWRGVNRDNSIIGTVGRNDDIRAMIFISIEPIYYSDAVQLVELWNFVRPDHRRSDLAKRMIGFAKRLADETGLDLQIGIVGDERLEAKRRLYDRYLPKGGVLYLYNAKRMENHRKLAESSLKLSMNDAMDALAEKMYFNIAGGRGLQWSEMRGPKRGPYRDAVRAIVDERALIEAASRRARDRVA